MKARYEPEAFLKGGYAVFSLRPYAVLSAMSYSNPFLSPKRTLLIGFDLPENCCVSEPR